MNAGAPVARSWWAALLVSLLALAPAHAAGQDPLPDVKLGDRVKAEDAILTLEVPLREFIELQRLDDGDRRLRLGLPDSCNPGITAMAGAISPSSRLFVLVTCSPTPAE